VVEADGFEGRLRDRLLQALEAAADGDGALRGRVPEALVEPARELARKPYAPDPEMVRALMDHRAVRGLIREVLQEALVRFGRSLRTKVPDPMRRVRKAPGLRGLVGVASGVASAVGGEVEKQLERRVRDFVDDAIGRSLEHSVSYLSGRNAAGDLGAFRAHALDVLLDHPVARYRAEVERLDGEGLTADVAQTLRALVSWEGLPSEAESLARAAIDAAGDRSLGALFEEEAPGERWRERLAQPLLERARAFVATEAFETWLTQLLA